MRFTAIIAMFPDVREGELVTWVERGWVRPQEALSERASPGGALPDWDFAEIDVARIRLIHDFRHVMAVPEETMPLVLSLLDQVYTLRGQMRTVARAVEDQPETVRAAIMAALRGRG